jgi:hypothetical protein
MTQMERLFLLYTPIADLTPLVPMHEVRIGLDENQRVLTPQELESHVEIWKIIVAH